MKWGGGVFPPLVFVTVRPFDILFVVFLACVVRPDRILGLRVVQDIIVDPSVFRGRVVVRTIALPHDLVPKTFSPENRIEYRFQVVAGSGVAVQIQAAVLAQHAVHLHEPHAHVAQERAHVAPVVPLLPLLLVNLIGRVDDAPHGGIVVLDGVDPLRMDVLVVAPAVLELAPGGEGVGRGVEVAALVEGRVGGDEVDRARVDGLQELEVVAVVERAVAEVRFGHGLPLERITRTPRGRTAR